ncbi:MAG: hypothetical protein HYS98_05185 [Deltaproteobacteria bacterium]|nr:hypothetical protein [Deltaproteobacteria bacterium]
MKKTILLLIFIVSACALISCKNMTHPYGVEPTGHSMSTTPVLTQTGALTTSSPLCPPTTSGPVSNIIPPSEFFIPGTPGTSQPGIDNPGTTTPGTPGIGWTLPGGVQSSTTSLSDLLNKLVLIKYLPVSQKLLFIVFVNLAPPSTQTLIQQAPQTSIYQPAQQVWSSNATQQGFDMQSFADTLNYFNNGDALEFSPSVLILGVDSSNGIEPSFFYDAMVCVIYGCQLRTTGTDSWLVLSSSIPPWTGFIPRE